MKRSQEQKIITRTPAPLELPSSEEPQDLRRRDWLILIVFYPLPAPGAPSAKSSNFKRLLEVISVLLKIAGMAYGLYQAIMAGGS